MKIVNKKRFVLSISIFLVIIISIFNLCFAKTIEVETEEEEYVVQTGDTIWSIAGEFKNNNQDIRNYIYELRNLNNLDDCIIYPGQVLKIIK